MSLLDELREQAAEAAQIADNYRIRDPKVNDETFEDALDANKKFTHAALAAAEEEAYHPILAERIRDKMPPRMGRPGPLPPDACTACILGSGLHRRGCVTTYGPSKE